MGNPNQASLADMLAKARELLDECRLSQPARRVAQYPFELSGGMLQRAMIAMAIACEPDILVALAEAIFQEAGRDRLRQLLDAG